MLSYIYGYHAIEERLKRKVVSGILKISKNNRRTEILIVLARKRGIDIQHVSDEELSTVTGTSKHHGAVLVVERENRADKGEKKLKNWLSARKSAEIKKYSLIIVLDGVTDPQNLGSIVRSADQFAVELVIVPSRRSVRDNATVSRVSSGADNFVEIMVVPNLARAIGQLKEAGFWVHGVDMAGKPVTDVDFSENTVLVMGSEGRGLHRLVRESCDEIVAIPRLGHVDSLNVGVAAGILMYEVRRQQGFKADSKD